jgi:hypothetical protein
MLLFCALTAFSQSGVTDSAIDSTENPRLATYAGRPRVFAVKLQDGEKIVLDGRFDEPVWKRALPAKDFVQQDPKNGQPPTELTEVRFAYNKDALYMAVTCFDSEPKKMLGNQILRDGFLPADDRFMWVMDPMLNSRTGYFFEMNPSGLMGDSLLGGSGDGRAWDGIWTAKTRKSEIGWVIEIEIPFKTLNFDPKAPAWGINFQRTVRRKQEESLWTSWGRNLDFRNLRNTGLLMGIGEDASQGKGLDIRPYFVGNITEAPAVGVDGKFKQKEGVDIFYNVTPQLRANFTVNTDFAETEVDQRRVNLTQFPLFFPERRQFFLEGSGFFDFGRWPGTSQVLPFFSRRIGLNVDGTPQRLDYGAKLTGQVGKYDIGFLEVRTASQDKQIGEDFTVTRVKRRFWRESYFGGIYTRRDERGTLTPTKQTMGGDFYLATSRFHGNKSLRLSGFYLWNTHQDRPNLGATSYGLRVDYPNDRWQLSGGVRHVGDAYDPAVGFNERRSFRRYDSNLYFTPRPKNARLIRRFLYGQSGFFNTALDNTLITSTHDLRVFGVQFQSLDEFSFHILPNYDRLVADFNIYPGIRLLRNTSYNFLRYSFNANTAQRRKVGLTLNWEDGQFYNGNRRQIISSLALRPRPGVLVQIDDEWNKVSLKEGRFSTNLERLTFNYQIGPWISFANTVQYDTISHILGWQSRFRWIMKPGNDLYVVYTHNWISQFDNRTTLDRGLATKVAFTKRF